MKKAILMIFIILTMALSSISFAEVVEVSVSINNQFVQDTAKHYLIDGNVFVVARTIIEALGGIVAWNPETQEVKVVLPAVAPLVPETPVTDGVIPPEQVEPTVVTDPETPPVTEETPAADTSPSEGDTPTEQDPPAEQDLPIEQGSLLEEVYPPGTTVMIMKIGSSIALVNGEEKDMGTAPILKYGKTYLPLRFMVEAFGCTVAWDQRYYNVNIQKEGYTLPPTFVYKRPYTDEDVLWLARIIQYETASGSPYKKLAVANVVLNRVKSPRFPNTIKEVIFQTGQFPPSRRDSFPTSVPSQACMTAAKRALEGINTIEDCLFFNNRPFTSKADSFYKLIEGDYFYR